MKNEIKSKFKLLITRGIIILPSTTLLIQVGRDKSLLTLKDVKENDEIVVLSQIDPEIDEPEFEDLFNIGVLCKVKKVNVIDQENIELTLKSIKTVLVDNFAFNAKIGHTVELEEYKYKPGNPTKNSEIISSITELMLESSNNETQSKEIIKIYEYILNNAKSSSKVADFIATNIPAPFVTSTEKQIYLESKTITEKLKLVLGFLIRYFDKDDSIKKSVDNIINTKMNNNISKQQKEFYLRERLKTVKEELGELSSREDDSDKIRSRLDNNPYPEYIREKVLYELNKYESAMSSNESSITKTYIDWLLDLPYWQEREERNDISEVEKILNKNHYGIEKIKERIVEHLAIRAKNKNAKSSIICLVGPPGVGKTSLAFSIAEALNKEFVKISLGGVKDESEIRGHRKTYIGAMPGRIIKAMKKAKVINPLFLLDELDKMASDQRGDPASAMLEVLDPEQNSKFSDNYIEEEYDLSNVLFIATANYYKQIPHALIDRLEIIELTSYTIKEKTEIAKHHLIKNIMKEYLIDETKLSWDDAAIDFIINSYTREAGVRDLERNVKKILRKYIVDEMKNKKLPTKIDIATVKKFLGKIIFDETMTEKQTIAGIVNGMAYTSVGGDLLQIEVTKSLGKGKILITGNLEKTMIESANVALGFVKANAENFSIDPKIFSEIDIHIHVPAGGVPKDGPSAGVALTTAIISMLKNKPINTNISMTGEITLRGKVGIIGGVKEKVISAHRAGVREIFIPYNDERYLEEVPKETLKDIKIHLVRQYEDIYNQLFK